MKTINLYRTGREEIYGEEIGFPRWEVYDIFEAGTYEPSGAHTDKYTIELDDAFYLGVNNCGEAALFKGESKTQVAIIDVSDGSREHPSVQLVSDGVFMDTTLEGVR